MTPLDSVLETDKYRIIRELGRGGMGVVYLAEDTRLKREVALKVLYEHLYQKSSFAERFQEEARSVSTLHHPNIVCVHGLEVANGSVAIDMEFVEGQSLDQLSASARVSPHMAVSIARDVLSGLVTCHQIGIVHRDIKPSNILIALDGTAKLTDFGLATAYASHLEDTVKGNTSTGFYMGTPRYMPPQAWEGGRPEPFWDLYSFGLVLYELLTGTFVFSGDSPMEIVKKQFTDPIPDLLPVTKVASPELVEVLDAMLRTAQEQSPRDASEMLCALERTPECKELSTSNGSTTITLPPIRRATVRAGARWRNARRSLQRSRALLGVVLALVLLMGLGVWLRTVPTSGAGPIPPSDSVAVTPHMPTFSEWARGSQAYVNGRLLAVDGVEEAGRWQITLDSAGAPQTILGYTDSGFWLVDVQSDVGNDTWRISGGWARYVQPDSRRMQMGYVQGHLVWEGRSDAMSISMNCVNEMSNAEHTVQLVLLLKQAQPDASDFVRKMESNSRLQYMLYTSLLDRPMDWPRRIEAVMPSVTGGRILVPRVEGEIVPDGQLAEELWSRSYYFAQGRIGYLAAQVPVRGPQLLVRWTEGEVVLGVHTEAQYPGSNLELAIMPSVGSGLASAYHFYAACDESGLYRKRFYESRRERRWESEWNFAWDMAMTVGEQGTDVEIRIPRKALETIARPEIGSRWRLNARWRTGDAEDASDLIAQWGDEEILMLEHGVLLEFTGASE